VNFVRAIVFSSTRMIGVISLGGAFFERFKGALADDE
jgi:hypothetical protein